MKGDLLLLGSVGVAMVAVPAAVLLWSGQPLPGVVAGLPLSVPVAAVGEESAAKNQGAFSQPAAVPSSSGGASVSSQAEPSDG